MKSMALGHNVNNKSIDMLCVEDGEVVEAMSLCPDDPDVIQELINGLITVRNALLIEQAPVSDTKH